MAKANGCPRGDECTYSHKYTSPRFPTKLANVRFAPFDKNICLQSFEPSFTQSARLPVGNFSDGNLRVGKLLSIPRLRVIFHSETYQFKYTASDKN